VAKVIIVVGGGGAPPIIKQPYAITIGAAGSKKRPSAKGTDL